MKILSALAVGMCFILCGVDIMANCNGLAIFWFVCGVINLYINATW